MDWAGSLLSPLMVLPIFVVAYLAAPWVAHYFGDK
jgi:hypothetical protein